MNFLRSIGPAWLCAALVFAALMTLAGCSSTEPDNMSARPWNAPNGFENGLPGGLMQQQGR